MKDHLTIASRIRLLSLSFPHKRADRRHGPRKKKLASITAQAWGLGSGRQEQLQRLRNGDSGFDVASAVRPIVEEKKILYDLQGSPTVKRLCSRDHRAGHIDKASCCHQFDSPPSPLGCCDTAHFAELSEIAYDGGHLSHSVPFALGLTFLQQALMVWCGRKEGGFGLEAFQTAVPSGGAFEYLC